MPLVLLRTTLSPEGTLARLAATVLGCRSIVSLSLIDVESVTVSVSWMNEGYSWSGALNDPLATPVNDCTGWLWQFPTVMQCCSVTTQLIAEAGSDPSSGSVPCPENAIVSPARQVDEGAGVSMNAVGGLLPAVIVTGSETSGRPWLSVTRSRTPNVPTAVYVNDGFCAVESSKAPSPSRSQA